MNKTLRNILIGLGAAVLAAIMIIGVRQPTKPTDTVLGATATLDAVDNPYVSINGIRQYYYNQQITATSSNFCILKNPFNATSTILSLSVSFSSTTAFTVTGGGGNQSVAYSISTTTGISTAGNGGSSTPAIVFNHGILAANAGRNDMVYQPGMATTGMAIANVVLPFASSTGETNLIFAPNEFLVFKWSTTTQPLAPTFTYWPQGNCRAVIQQI